LQIALRDACHNSAYNKYNHEYQYQIRAFVHDRQPPVCPHLSFFSTPLTALSGILTPFFHIFFDLSPKTPKQPA